MCLTTMKTDMVIYCMAKMSIHYKYYAFYFRGAPKTKAFNHTWKALFFKCLDSRNMS